MSLQSRTVLPGTVALLLLTQGSGLADEGMWTLDNFPAARIADRYGTQVDEAFLQRLQLATTRIEGGCTGSFASPDGLILTNHHCIQRCLTELSSADDDKRASGFLAAGRDDEKRCASEQISVLVDFTDVTDRVAAAIAGLDQEEANQVRKSTLTELENECTATSGDDVSVCESVTLYHGGQYFLYKYKRYDDIRLVFAPEQSIAAFGGDP
ncbi:MAG: S46 family peptidase, partial [Pseudomonadota bacterium]